MKHLMSSLCLREQAVADRIIATLISTQFLVLIACVPAYFLAGCGAAPVNAGPQPANESISISPNITALPAGSRQMFVATVLNASNNAVTWTVMAGTSATQTQNSNGSNASGTVGTIDSSGLYTAPTNLLSSISVQVSATSAVNS